MTIQEWNLRYLTGERAAQDIDAAPTPLLQGLVDELVPGTALDLACGAGRNALYLARLGWNVTAVDGAAAAIDILRSRAAEWDLSVRAVVADLEKPRFEIQADAWDLIVVCYYLQRDLFPVIRRGVRNGGSVLAIVHIAEDGEAPSAKRARPGELRSFFAGWEIQHDREGKPSDSGHRRSVAEIIAKRPQ